MLNTHQFGDPDGAPLLAVHGITAHGRRFRRLAEEAWPQRHTLAVDLRGHGHSTFDGPWSLAQLVADLCETLDDAGVGTDTPVDVVTHSYGGAIGVRLLAAAPERVRRLVLLDPAIGLPAAKVEQAATDAVAHEGWETVEAATIARNAGFGDEIIPAVVEDVAAHLELGDDGRYRMRWHLPAVVTGWGEMGYPLPTGLRSVPTLLVIADRAGFVSADTVEALTATFGAELETVHLDCGHMLYWECFDETAAAVSEFLTTT